MTLHAVGSFEVEMRPAAAELDGASERFEFTKTFTGEIDGTSVGVMLSGGDPSAGTAGYVAIEIFRGRVHDQSGSFMLQQFGQMRDGEQRLHYEIVNGSGADGLEGIRGGLDLTIDDSGHHVDLAYTLP